MTKATAPKGRRTKTEQFEVNQGHLLIRFTIITEHNPEAVAEQEKFIAESLAAQLVAAKGIAGPLHSQGTEEGRQWQRVRHRSSRAKQGASGGRQR